MDRGAWQATVHGVTKSWTGLRDETTVHNGQDIILPSLSLEHERLPPSLDWGSIAEPQHIQNEGRRIHQPLTE